MVRPLRIEFSGAVYHVTSQGDDREGIYLHNPLSLLFKAYQSGGYSMKEIVVISKKDSPRMSDTEE